MRSRLMLADAIALVLIGAACGFCWRSVVDLIAFLVRRAFL